MPTCSTASSICALAFTANKPAATEKQATWISLTGVFFMAPATAITEPFRGASYVVRQNIAFERMEDRGAARRGPVTLWHAENLTGVTTC